MVAAVWWSISTYPMERRQVGYTTDRYSEPCGHADLLAPGIFGYLLVNGCDVSWRGRGVRSGVGSVYKGLEGLG